MTLATVHTLGIDVPFSLTLMLCVLSALAACGASGIAGGSLLLIPLACSLLAYLMILLCKLWVLVSLLV